MPTIGQKLATKLKQPPTIDANDALDMVCPLVSDMSKSTALNVKKSASKSTIGTATPATIIGQTWGVFVLLVT